MYCLLLVNEAAIVLLQIDQRTVMKTSSKIIRVTFNFENFQPPLVAAKQNTGIRIAAMASACGEGRDWSVGIQVT